jgi:hypothetical protein
MSMTRQRRQPDEAVHATGLLAALSAQRAAPSHLTICAEAVLALWADVRRVHTWVRC